MQIQGNYNLLVSDSWKQSQTRNVTLDCLTEFGEVTINLPLIADIFAVDGELVKITINDFSGQASANNIFINSTAPDTIDNDATDQLIISTDGGSVVIEISSSKDWVALASSSAGSGGGGGGTGALYRAVIELSSDGEAMTNTVLYSNFPDDITVDQLSQGVSGIEFNTNPIPQVMQGMMWNNAGDYWRSFVAVQEGAFLYIQETSLNGDSWGDGDYAESEGLKTVLVLEYYTIPA